MSNVLNMRRLVNAVRYSYAGLSDGVRRHTSFRQEVAAGAVLVPLAVWLGDDGLQRAAMLSSLVLVLIVELLNSAVETVVDRIGTEEHELSGQAKDLGSAAVMLSLLNVPLVWGLILLG